jgi:hypothetical protein
MPITQGECLVGSLDAQKLTNGERDGATQNATQIVTALVTARGSAVATAVPGAASEGGEPTQSPTGLVYGRIQSGKTRAMITSAALAFDNQFRIVVVLTSNNNRLVDQTGQDFRDGLPGNIGVFSKAHFQGEIRQAKQILDSGKGGVVVICSKEPTRLPQAIEFLKNIGAGAFPSIIFDDEGDQATLDTNTQARSTKNPSLPASKIHRLIHDSAVQSLRQGLSQHVFVSVTGTPSGIVLQNADNQSRPAFIELLEAGKGYVGGEKFFSEPDPEKNPLISLIDENERVLLLEDEQSQLPTGLRQAIQLFLLAAAAAGEDPALSWPQNGTGYKLLCHPSVKTSDQEKVADLIRDYLADLAGALTKPEHHLRGELEAAYASLKKQTATVPELTKLLATIEANLASRAVLVLNANTTGKELSYSKHFNFLIGGNTLGRGLAIKNLLVTYYVREAKVTQMDTMYQHARMFGYRESTLPYTRVFLPPQLYFRFQEIYISDEELRDFIERYKASPTTLPVRIAKDIRATRKSVLDARLVDILIPGRQIYPNYPYFQAPEAASAYTKVQKKLEALFPNYKTAGNTGVKVTTEQAQELVALIKTKGTNVWRDKKIPTILSYLGEQFPDGVILKFRTAERKAGDENGLLQQGILTGSVVTNDGAGENPVLWILDTTFSEENKPSAWDGGRFMYPTLVLPTKASLLIFNKS